VRKVTWSINKILNVLETGPIWFGMLLFFTMLWIAAAGVILRYFFDKAIPWELEVTALMMAWGTFMGVGSVTRSNMHVRITFFADLIWGRLVGKERTRMAYSFLESIIGFCVAGYFAWVAATWVQFTYTSGARSLGDIWYELWIPRLAILIGFSLVSLMYLERIVKQVNLWVTRKETVVGLGGWEVDAKPEDEEQPPQEPTGETPQEPTLS
jgi:TRAP-type C4-dicarboxylate transport system permease small subunit